VTDQALFAGANFLASILLARWLEPAAYGAFSLAYALFLLLGTLHTGLLTEPMLVYGSGRFRESFAAYQRVLLRYHWRFGALATLVFLLLTAACWACGARETAKSFLGLAFAAPAVLYLWIVRRGAYVLLNPRLAALGGGLYLLLYLTLSILLLRASLLDATTTFLSMAVAGLVSAEVIRSRLKAGTELTAKPEEMRNLHWSYGRWALLAGLFSWVPGNIYYLLLPAFHGLEAAAQFKALMNLLMPILHFNGALGQLLVPEMVRAVAQGKLKRLVLTSITTLTALSVLYWILLIYMGSKSIKLLYLEKYANTKEWIFWIGLLPVLTAVVVVMSSALKAVENPKIVAQININLSILTIIFATPLVFIHGLDGAVLMLLSSYIFLSISFIMKKK